MAFPQCNALLPMRYFVQVVKLVIWNEWHISYQNSSQSCILGRFYGFVSNNQHDPYTKYPFGSIALWEGLQSHTFGSIELWEGFRSLTVITASHKIVQYYDYAVMYMETIVCEPSINSRDQHCYETLDINTCPIFTIMEVFLLTSNTKTNTSFMENKLSGHLNK